MSRKYKSWRITGALPWGGLVFVAGFTMQTVSIYKDHDLGIYIAKVVLLLIAPSVTLTISISLVFETNLQMIVLCTP